MTTADVRHLLKEDGWVEQKTTKDYIMYKHPTKPGTITLPMSIDKEIPPGVLDSILDQAGFKPPA